MSELTYSRLLYCSGSVEKKVIEQETEALRGLASGGFDAHLSTPNWNLPHKFEFNRLHWKLSDHCERELELGGLAIVGAGLGVNLALSLFDQWRKRNVAVVSIADRLVDSNIRATPDSLVEQAYVYGHCIILPKLPSYVSSGMAERISMIRTRSSEPLDESLVAGISIRKIAAASYNEAVVESITMLPDILAEMAENSASV